MSMWQLNHLWIRDTLKSELSRSRYDVVLSPTPIVNFVDFFQVCRLLDFLGEIETVKIDQNVAKFQKKDQ